MKLQVHHQKQKLHARRPVEENFAYLRHRQVATAVGVVHRHVQAHAEEVLVNLGRKSWE
jgi:hypothetical protein